MLGDLSSSMSVYGLLPSATDVNVYMDANIGTNTPSDVFGNTSICQ